MDADGTGTSNNNQLMLLDQDTINKKRNMEWEQNEKSSDSRDSKKKKLVENLGLAAVAEQLRREQ